MHYMKNKPTYESVRKIPVIKLLQMSEWQLKRLEKRIKNEVFRAQLALKWIQGIRRIKKIKED